LRAIKTCLRVSVLERTYTLHRDTIIYHLLNSFCNSRRNRQRETKQLPTTIKW